MENNVFGGTIKQIKKSFDKRNGKLF
jgi:hypothetical protein